MDVNRGAERRRTSIWNHTQNTHTERRQLCQSSACVMLSSHLLFWTFVKALEVRWCAWGWIQNHLWHNKAALSYFTALIAPAASITLSFVYTFALDEKGIMAHPPHKRTLLLSFSHFLCLSFHCHGSMFCSTMGCHCNSSDILVCTCASICECVYM